MIEIELNAIKNTKHKTLKIKNSAEKTMYLFCLLMKKNARDSIKPAAEKRRRITELSEHKNKRKNCVVSRKF
ncbi:MAG: hypothetical protein K6B17_09930 [Treponema sp.]|nr:hypothetical protein [Treponema sp.]